MIGLERGIEMGQTKTEIQEAMDRRERKRERDREYWGRHRPRLNKDRRMKYAVERALLQAAEDAAGEE